MTAATAASRAVFDVAVVGLGAVGSALAWQLARRGARVVGIDRHHPPHDQGSSHGRTRITRLAVGEGADYVPLALRSHALWREIEAATGDTLYRATGAAVIGSPDADAGAFHGQPGFFASTLQVARRHGIAHERLDAAQARERCPAFCLRDDESVYLEPAGGVLFPEACVGAQLRLAERDGAVLRLGETVRSLDAMPSGVAIRTDRGTLHAGHAVLAAGAWLPALVGAPLTRCLRVLRQVLHWFAVERPDWYVPERCPVFIWLHGPRVEDAMYGFPMIDGVAGVKVATEQLALTSDPDAVNRDIAPSLAGALFDRHIQGRLRGLLRTAVDSASCLYTMADDGRFVIDRHPRHDHVTIVSACSGHGFKHSAALGEAVAQQVLGVTPRISLAPFALRD